MSLKFKALGLVAALVLAGCGSGDNKKDDFDGEPFVNFTVNGERNPAEVTIERVHQEYINSNNTTDTSDDTPLDPFCDSDTFANGEYVAGIDSKYCASERSLITIKFSVQFYNNTYDNFDLSYQGLGYTVKIFRFDKGQPDKLGDEVWSSDYEFQKNIEILKIINEDPDLEDYNPEEDVGSRTLGPIGVFPNSNEDLRAENAIFFYGHRNFREGSDIPVRSPDPFQADFLYNWPSESNDGLPGLCDWSLVAYETDDPQDEDPLYNKVQCGSLDLLPLPSVDVPPYDDEIYSDEPGEEGYIKFIARVEFNFNDGEFQSPEDITIIITPPSEE